MGKHDFLFASTITELSEEKEYLTLNNRVFFFNAPNLNGVQLNYDESSYEQCKSLINMPLVAKYIKRDGKDDLGGHEVSFVDGEMQFGTQAIGVITDIDIVEEDVETCNGEIKRLPCLYATERVWKRYKNVANAVQRLYSEGNLYNSWELKNNEYVFKDGIKYISQYEFLGNCLLGTQSFPAYGKGGAKVLDISQVDQYEYLAAEAFSEALALDTASMSASNINLNQLDENKSDRKEMTPKMEANENIVVENSEVETKEEAVEIVDEAVEETAEVSTEEVENNEEAEVSEENPVSDDAQADNTEVEASEDVDAENTEAEEVEEVSAKQTNEDIQRKIWDAVDKLRDERGDWYYLAMHFPEDHIILVQTPRMPKLQFIQYSYEITDDEAILSNKQEVEMTISPLNINSEIENKNNALAEANSRIEELTKCKEELDKIKAEQAEANRTEAVNKLREYVVKSGRFTEEEIASENVQNAINSLNEAWIKSEIADRLVASMAESHNDSVATASKSAVNDSTVSILLSSSEKDNTVTGEDIINRFFNRD